MFQCLLGVRSLNKRLYVCEMRCERGFSLKQRFSNGVVGLDQSGIGVGLIRKFLIWMYVQKGKVAVSGCKASSVSERRRCPT